MNVYDFDGTIYDGDSSVDLIKYAISRYPKLWTIVFPMVGMYGGYLLHFWDKAKGKSGWYRIMKRIDDPEGFVKEFWDKHEKKIFPWYLEQKRPDDIITSASPGRGRRFSIIAIEELR